MSEELMDDEYVKNKAPTIVIIFCASFMMLIQTIASGLAVVGYDDVIRADAKTREAKILNEPNKECVIDEDFKQQVNDRLTQLEINSHEPGVNDAKTQ